MVTAHNKFGEFTQDELLELRTGLISTSTYGYDVKLHSDLYSELDRAWDEKEKIRLASIPRCTKCGHELK